MTQGEREAQKLKRISDIELVYTLFMVFAIIVDAGFAAGGYWWSIPAALVLFAPKAWLHSRWQRQLDVTCEVSPEARRLAEARGYR